MKKRYLLTSVFAAGLALSSVTAFSASAEYRNVTSNGGSYGQLNYHITAANDYYRTGIDMYRIYSAATANDLPVASTLSISSYAFNNSGGTSPLGTATSSPNYSYGIAVSALTTSSTKGYVTFYISESGYGSINTSLNAS